MRPPLLVFALLGPLPTSAFYPTKFRANLSMIPGISHEQMTEEVLTSAATSFFPSVAESLNGTLGASLSQGMLEARTVIVRSNAWVDWGYHMPYWHFDGDSDLESVETLEGARAALVKHMIEGDVSAARTNLGQALHLVQDYYAYRNAAEESDGFEDLWRRDPLSQSTSRKDEPRSHNHMGENPYDIATGKSRGRGRETVREDFRVQRQGAEEAQHNIMIGHTLHSNESDRHLRAVELAKEASEIFINYIAEYLTDRQLQHLFGLSLDSAILVDPTSFASPDWEGARAKIDAMFGAVRGPELDVKRAVKYTTISLLSQSPSVTYEDWYPLETTNASQSLDILREAVAGYGIGCHGIRLEAVLGALQQFEAGGELIFVVGQDFVEDSELESEIVDFIANKPVAVTILKLETECSKKEELTLSQSVADLSGGKYITALDTHEKLAFTKDETLEAQAGLGVIQVNSNSGGTSQDDIRFPVDGTMDRLLVTLDWATPTEFPTKVLFSDSKEKTFEPVVRSSNGGTQRAIWKIDSPNPGKWAFSFGGGSTPAYNLTVKGRSSIQLVRASIVESAGIPGHEGYFDILKDVLPAETQVGVVGEIYGLGPADNSAVEWFVVDADTGDEAKLPMSPGLDPAERPGYADQNTFFGGATLPEGSFYIVVRGVDAQGYKFQRSVPSRMSAKYNPDETYDIGDVDSVVDFPDSSEDEEDDPEERQQIVARQIVTRTGATEPGAASFIPTGPFFPNTTVFPGTGATTLRANATAVPLPTAPTSLVSPVTGTSGFNTSVPSVTIPIPSSANATGPAGATETAGATFQPPAPVPTGPGLPGVTESLTTVATILPETQRGSNATLGVSLTSSFGSNATATAQADTGESLETVTVTASCYGQPQPGQTLASQDAISQPVPKPSSPQSCKACEAQSPEGPAAPPKETFTEAQHPDPYPQPPAKPQETEVIPNTAPAEKTIETTKTRLRTSVIPAQTPPCAACAPQGYGPETPMEHPESRGSAAPPLPTTSGGVVYGGDTFTASVNGTSKGQGHVEHTTSSTGAEETADGDETDESAAGETASGEGIKGVGSAVVAVVVVAVGSMVFLIL